MPATFTYSRPLDQGAIGRYDEATTCMTRISRMSAKVSVHQLQDCLPELIDRVVKTGEECVVQRNGKDCAVIVSARKWRGRGIALQLDALGPAYRLARPKQARVEQLLEAKDKR